MTYVNLRLPVDFGGREFKLLISPVFGVAAIHQSIESHSKLEIISIYLKILVLSATHNKSTFSRTCDHSSILIRCVLNSQSSCRWALYLKKNQILLLLFFAYLKG